MLPSRAEPNRAEPTKAPFESLFILQQKPNKSLRHQRCWTVCFHCPVGGGNVPQHFFANRHEEEAEQDEEEKGGRSLFVCFTGRAV